ncbi:MAG: MFS transporter [Candidatus Heimdallarchaeota archaeon]|nr:MFS transporter [Candidatus Heimdallarchaeota archaeon]
MNETVSEKAEEKDSIKVWVLISATGIGAFLASLDGTIVNISLPQMMESLDVAQHQVQWIVLSYLLTMIAFTTVSGDLGDRISNKLIFQIGMVIFSVASLLCFFARSLGVLVLFRILQGIGATGLVANGMAIITRFTSRENRGLAIGLNSLLIALGISLGPILGGALTEFLDGVLNGYSGWPFIFLINVPVGLIGFFWVQYIIPPTPPLTDSRRKADILGSLFLSGFLFLLVFCFSVFASIFDHTYFGPNKSHWPGGVVVPYFKTEVGTFGPFAKLLSGLSLGFSIIFLIAFIFWEKHTKHPVIDLSMFKNRRFTVGIFSGVLAYLGLCVIIYQLPFFVQQILHYTTFQTGVAIMGTPIGMALAAVLSGAVSNKIDVKYLSTAGIGIMMLSLVLGALFITEQVPIYVIIIIATIIGISLGIFIAPNNTSVMSSAPEKKLGIANSMLSLSTNVGFSLGTALATAVFVFSQNKYQSINGGRIEDVINYVPAMRVLFGVFAGFMLFSTIFSYFRGPKPKIEINKT